MSKSTSRIPSLDGIRAVSIALVMISHYGRDSGHGDPFELGSLGVRIFFVISGFLITGLLLQEMEQEGHIHLLRFYFRRTLRIFPAFYFYLACILLLASRGLAELSFRQALPALTYTSNYDMPSLWLIVHTWSLATEEQFYLIWPAALMLSGRRRGLAVLLGLLIIAPVSSHFLSHRLGHEVPAFFNSPIGIGCLLSLIRPSLHRNRLYRRWIHSHFGLVLPFVVLATNSTALRRGGLADTALSLVLNLSIALSLDWAVVNHDGFIGRILNLGSVTYIGLLSYSLYLWQEPFLSLNEGSFYLSGHWKSLTNAFARIAAIAICTMVSYYFVERPMLRLRSWVEPKLFKRDMPIKSSYRASALNSGG